jgi:hypothetical protein
MDVFVIYLFSTNPRRRRDAIPETKAGFGVGPRG